MENNLKVKIWGREVGRLTWDALQGNIQQEIKRISVHYGKGRHQNAL